MSMKWYVVHTYSGFEDKVKLTIEEKAKLKGFDHKIGRILVPKEKLILLKGKTKRETDKKFYPGYIIVEMELDDEMWLFIKNTMKVTGFVGGLKPVPVSDDEIELIIQQIEKGPTPAIQSQFNKNDHVKIIDGPFNNFVGIIDEVDMDHGRVKVMVSIFGRQTPVELSFNQVEKN
ncbi:MAG TPA: transcription termination/antitermination protein NusG [Nitrospirae bacterium]|nr:transcription termination/antitermination protein NusG [Nitrospirota bacterium]